jgi:hypothetical protein
MANALRKLRKNIKPEPEPMILFIPDENYKYAKFIAEQADVITVTDRKIYTKVLDVVTKCIEQGRLGVVKGGKDEEI